MNIISLKEAVNKGLTRYFTGKPCKYGHVSERLVAGRKCLECHLESQRQRSNDGRNKEYKRKYMSNPENRERSNRLSRERRSNNPDYKTKRNEYQRSEKYKEYRRNYQKRDEYLSYRRERSRFRYKNDPLYKSNILCHQMLRKVLKATKTEKYTKCFDMLGYSAAEFKQRIESQFKDGMSWDNHGDWHVDHIIPVAVMMNAGVTDPKEINALSNLQPLWAFDNLSKRDRYIG